MLMQASNVSLAVPSLPQKEEHNMRTSLSLSFSFLSSVIKTCSPECCNRVLFEKGLVDFCGRHFPFYGSLGP